MATQFVRYVRIGLPLACLWLALAVDRLLWLSLSAAWMQVVHSLPGYLLLSLACYALATVSYRVATFNDCTDAAEQLKEEITEARRVLRSKGIKL